MEMSRLQMLAPLLGILLIASCNQSPTVIEVRRAQPSPPAANPPPLPEESLTAAGANEPPKQAVAANDTHQSEPEESSADVVEKNKKQKKKAEPANRPASGTRVVFDSFAVKRAEAAVRDCVDLGPTLVVWLLDGTASAQDLVHSVSTHLQNFYTSSEVTHWS